MRTTITPAIPVGTVRTPNQLIQESSRLLARIKDSIPQPIKRIVIKTQRKINNVFISIHYFFHFGELNGFQAVKLKTIFEPNGIKSGILKVFFFGIGFLPNGRVIEV
jgi:hypothetical protein